MSMELYVLSDTRLTSISEWQQAIDASGFPLRLSAVRPFAELSGVLPVQLSDRQVAFECDHWDLGDLVETYDDIDFGHRWKYTSRFAGPEIPTKESRCIWQVVLMPKRPVASFSIVKKEKSSRHSVLVKLLERSNGKFR